MSRLLATALAVVLVAPAQACKLESPSRVQSINRMNEGIEFFQKKNMSAAEKALKEAIEIDPTHAKAHFILGQIYRKQGKLVDAQKEFEAAIQHMGEQPDADYPYQLGSVFLEQARQPGVTQAEKEAKYQEALKAFEQALKVNPKHYRTQYKIGFIYEKLDKPKEADQAYRKVIEMRPDFSPAFVDLGNMYIDYGFANVAMAVLDAGAKVNPKDARMWNGLGRAYLSLNKPKEAVEAFEKAKAIDPDMVDVLFGLGMAYAQLRKRTEAIEAFQAFLSKAGAQVPEDKRKAAQDTMARMQDVI